MDDVALWQWIVVGLIQLAALAFLFRKFFGKPRRPAAAPVVPTSALLRKAKSTPRGGSDCHGG